ncbi:PmoA family protein [soil metagenome]
MKDRFFLCRWFCCLLFIYGCDQSKSPASQNSTTETNESTDSIELIHFEPNKKVDVLINGELFTSYLYSETIKKPVLYPLKTTKGTPLTRGFPLEPRAGERVDHPHHVGLWFNYGDVNGLDFWNNSDSIKADKRKEMGTIRHKEIKNISSGKDASSLEVSMDWVQYDGKSLLEENTTFIFRENGNTRTIDRITTLTALDQEVNFKDNKEGMLGIRVARELEHPSDKEEIFTDASGKPTQVAQLNNSGVEGKYKSSEGIEGDEVWGTRGAWVTLNSNIKDENVSLVIIDHPENPGYPTYWHARGYGLFSANNLGQKALSNGKDELNFKLPAGESVTFKHRIIVHSGDHLSDEKINSLSQDFEQLD